MLALRRVPLRPGRPHISRTLSGQGCIPGTPANRRYLLQNLCDGFLDLASALPLPPSLPPYSTTIILATVVARFAILPTAIWAKRRSVRLEEVAVKELDKMKPLVAKQVFETMKSQGVRGDKEYLKKYHAERSIAALKEIQKGLFKKYKCSPLPTILVPVAAQLPVFVIGSVMLARLSQDPTPFDSESFLTLTTLAHTDSTMTFPIVLGILAMANVESRSNWFLNAAEKEQARKVEEQRAKALAESKEMKLRPANMIKPILRVASVVRIGLCALVPGSVAIYWVTSAAFGLGQTWVMDWLDIRRRRRNAAAQAPSAQPMPAMQPTPSSSPILKSKLKRRS